MLASWVGKIGRRRSGNGTGATNEDPRQCDWRFLLPELPDGNVLCTGSPTAQVADIQATPGKYELIVARRPVKLSMRGMLRWRGWTLPRLADATGPDAQMYLEIDHPSLALPPRLLKMRLRRLGFTDVTFYWPKPGFAPLEMLMPLGDRRLQRYYLRRLFFGTSLTRKVLRSALTLLAEAGLFEMALPGYIAVARKRAGSLDKVDSTTPFLLKSLITHWASLRTNRPAPAKIQWIVLNGGLSKHSKLVCPCWLDDDPEPALVLKFQRDPQYNDLLDAEYHALTNVQSYLPDGQARTPLPCGSLTIEGTLVTVETTVPGRPLATYLQEHPRSQFRILSSWESLALWLARLHANSARPATDTEMATLLLDPLQNAGEELAFSQREGEAMQQLYDTALKLSKDSPLPLVYNHNDLGAPNVMCIAGKFRGVVDWESGGFGLPGTDLIYFLGSFAYLARSEGIQDQLRGFKEMFFESGTSSTARGSEISPGTAQQWLEDYCRRLGISTRWLPVLFGLCWTMHARNEKQQAEQQTAPVSSRTPGYFRNCLHFYLENIERLSIVESATLQEARAE